MAEEKQQSKTQAAAGAVLKKVAQQAIRKAGAAIGGWGIVASEVAGRFWKPILAVIAAGISLFILPFLLMIVVFIVIFGGGAPDVTQARPRTDVCSAVNSNTFEIGMINLLNRNIDIYRQAAAQADIPWEVLAAVHYEEHTNSRVTPEDNSDTETNETGDGVYQIVGAGYPYPALHILTDAEFLEQSIDAANFIQRKASTSTTPGLAEPLRQNMDPADAQDQANIKDAFWGYNGRAPYMMDIADELGFNPATEGYEGSYYVMNNWDEARVGMERRWIDKNGDLQIRRMTRDGAWKIFILLRNASYGEDGKLVRINEGCGDLPGSGGGDGSAPTGCPVIGRISTPMGINIPGYDGPHRGVDIAVGNDTPVQSTISGTAEIFPADGTMDPNGGGYMVNVKNANYTVKFAHLMPTGRVSGDVKIGDVMGQSDDSGASTGPHLHYGIYNNNDINTPLNPMDYMPVTLNYTQPANNDFSTYTGPNVAGGNWGSCNALP